MPVPSGEVADTPAQAKAIAAKLGGKVVVKAQVHAGGRGKARRREAGRRSRGGRGGGDADPRHDAQDPADASRGHQGPQGARRGGLAHRRRALPLDDPRPRPRHATSSWPRRPAAWRSRRSRRRIRRRSSASGPIPPLGLQPFQARNLAFGLGLTGDQFKAGVALILNLFRAYLEKDCSLAEINPLVVTRDGRVLALDAKLNFDDNALYRHKEIVALRDTNEETPARRRGVEVRPQLHQARRQRRLHGQRRRARHGDHGHHQARGRRARQLPRRGRRRLPGADRERLPHPLLRSVA